MSTVSGNVPDNTVQRLVREEADRMLAEMLADREAPLHPDLIGWADENHPTLGRVLRHPLVYQVPLHSPGLANRMLEQKRQAISKALAAGDLGSVVFLHERPYRLKALVEYCTGRYDDGSPVLLASVPEHWDLAADVWVDSENIGQVMDEWEALIGDADGLWLGNDEERAAFDALPDPIPAWRGEIDDGGWSYTTDKKIAEFFAHRWGAQDVIAQLLIPKDRVFGYLTRRGESELLVRREG